jgi:hypothetical protein
VSVPYLFIGGVVVNKLILTIGCFDHGKSRIQRGIFYANLLTILFAATIILFPVKAISGVTNPCTNVSGDIEFAGTNMSTEYLNFTCDGPWFRSGIQQIPYCFRDGPPCTCTFYAAKITAFSPYGLWICNVSLPFTDVVLGQTDFCVEKGDTKVNLVYDSGGDSVGLRVDKPPPPCHSSVSSFLGDNSKQEKSKPDSDVFLFDGKGGDQVTVRLEANPQAGNNGGEASLAISGNSVNESTTGTPPLELETTLPGAGEYSVTVEQPKNSALRFRGSYILSVIPANGSIDSIEPTNNVEK